MLRYEFYHGDGEGEGGGEGRNSFLVGPKDEKISALTFFGFVFRSHMKSHDKSYFLCKY